MSAARAWSSAWIVLELLCLIAAPVTRAAGEPDPAPRTDWFASDCDTPVELHPARPAPMWLRVLTAPDDAGRDALLIRVPDGALYAPPEVFAAIDLAPSGPVLHRAGTEYRALHRIAGLRFAVDACRQTLSLDRAGVGATTARTLLQTPGVAIARPESGGYLQAQTLWLHSGSQQELSGMIDGALFGDNGLLQNTLLFGNGRVTRLDTRWLHDDPAQMTRLALGDGITRGGSFGRSLRFAGVQWGRDFTLRPDLVTFPLPEISDAAALPSAVDVYVDNTLRASDRVPGGPFTLSDVPVLSGAGELQLVITDLLGRSRVVSYTFYAAPDLLRAGLSDYTLEAGFERRDYGRDSLDYGPGFGAATWRHGINDRLTVEAHAEASARRRAGGLGYALLLPRLGVFSAGIARGGGDSRGGQLSVALDRQSRSWSYSAQHLVGSEGFLRLGETQPASLRRSVVRTSWRLGSSGLSAGWIANRTTTSRTETANLAYNQQLRSGLSASLGAAFDLTGAGNDSIVGTLSWLFDPALSAYAYAQHSDAGTLGRVGVQRNPADTLDWSARAAVDRGSLERISAGADYRSTRATLHADVEYSEEAAVRLGIDSGIVILGSDRIWTRPLDGPFAVVETSARNPVDVYVENRRAGATRAGAPLLLPDLRGNQLNRVAVSQADFAIEERLDTFTRTVVAPSFGGLRVRFDADPRAMRRLRLLLPDQSPVPAGSDIAVDGRMTDLFTGLRGEATLLHDPGIHRLQVRWPAGSCTADVTLNADDTLLQPPLDVRCWPDNEDRR